MLGVVSARNAVIRRRTGRILGLTEDSTRRLPSPGNSKAGSAGTHNSKASEVDRTGIGKCGLGVQISREPGGGKLFQALGLCYPKLGIPELPGTSKSPGCPALAGKLSHQDCLYE